MRLSTSDDLYGRTIVSVSAAYDAQFKPLGDLALARLNATDGERIIDVGCGAAQTCMQLADAVGGRGEVLGIDQSPVLVDFAATRTRSVPQVRIVEGDAATYAFEVAGYDALFSRFGVMTFSKPVQAFSNLRRALKPDGRLAFVCWRSFRENELDYLPFRACADHLAPEERQGVEAAAPFSFENAALVRDVLASSGFRSVYLDSHDLGVMAGDLESTMELCMSAGALGSIIRKRPYLRQRVENPLREALRTRISGASVVMRAAVWVVSARAG